MDENNNLGNQNPNTNINPYDLNNQPQEANNLQDSQGQVSNNINENSVKMIHIHKVLKITHIIIHIFKTIIWRIHHIIMIFTIKTIWVQNLMIQ